MSFVKVHKNMVAQLLLHRNIECVGSTKGASPQESGLFSLAVPTNVDKEA